MRREGATASRARCLVAVLLACATFLPTGCGSGSSIEARKTAAFVAAANNVCRLRYDNRADPTYKEAVRARFRKVGREDRSLPSLHRFRTDLDARRKLRDEIERAVKHTGARVPLGSDPLETEYRLSLRIYDDEKALAMTACAIRPRAPIGG